MKKEKIVIPENIGRYGKRLVIGKYRICSVMSDLQIYDKNKLIGIFPVKKYLGNTVDVEVTVNCGINIIDLQVPPILGRRVVFEVVGEKRYHAS